MTLLPSPIFRFALFITVGGLVVGCVANGPRRELLRMEPRAAMDRISASSAGTARDDTLAIAAAGWVRLDTDSAVAWLRGLPENELKQRLTSTIGFELAQTNPNRAIALAETLPEGRNRWLLLGAIAQTWVAGDAKAARWVRSLPRSERSDEMIERTARHWLTTNPDAAEAWLLDSTLSPDRKERLLRQAGR